MHQERRWYPTDLLCRALRISRAAYYAWLRGRGRQREQADALLLKDIRRVYGDHDRNYGSPRVYRELRTTGVSCSKARVERLMRDNGLRAKQAKKFKVTTNSKHNLPVSPNILAGRFEWAQPNQAWVGDITYSVPSSRWHQRDLSMSGIHLEKGGNSKPMTALRCGRVRAEAAVTCCTLAG